MKKQPYKRNPTGNPKARQIVTCSLDYETSLKLHLLCMADNLNRSVLVSKTINLYWDANKDRLVGINPDDAKLGFKGILEHILEK